MFSEWIAYEQFAGPIGSRYMLETQRTIIDLIRVGNYIAGGQYKNNPAPKPDKPFPSEVEYMQPEPVHEEEEPDPEAAMDFMDNLTGKREK